MLIRKTILEFIRIFCPWLSCFALSSFGNVGSAEDTIDFTEQVRPILSDRCYFCHGPDSANREADLRLDIEEDAHASAIVPGSIEDSELIARILSTDPDEIMPPPDSNLSLTRQEREVLTKWVEQGASYDKHWAFVSPKRVATPKNNCLPIDYFVSRKLKSKKLELSDEADKETLIRRLSFDLTGLPPTLAEIDAFLEDQSEDAYERLVDRLLATEQYGERMAVDWLDVARYADTHGYQSDVYRPMWPWRDWVVSAFNKNIPYDQFITWQIAGDLLPEATQEQILATAFNRHHRQTNEGGSVEEEFRAEYVADRVNTFGAAFLGLTLECSRCHDHKYDPISQKEYYQLAAFFNSIDESGLYSHFTNSTPTPALQLTSQDQAKQISRLETQISEIEAEIANYRVAESDFAAWRSSLRDMRPRQAELASSPPKKIPNETSESDSVLKASLAESLESSLSRICLGDFDLEGLVENKVPNRANPEEVGKASDNPVFEPGKIGNAVVLSGDNNVAVPAGGKFTRDQPFSIALWVNAPEKFERAVVFHRSRAWTDSASRGYELLIENGRLSAALIHFWPGNAMRVVSKDALPINQWAHVTVTYDGSSRADGLKIYLDGELQELNIVRDKLTRTIAASPAELALGQRFRDKGFKNGRVDELKVFAAELSALEVQYIYLKDESPANIREFLYNLPDEALHEFFTAEQGKIDELRSTLAELRGRRSKVAEAVSEIMVMVEDKTPRQTYILTRGAYDAPGEMVSRALPSAILPEPVEQNANRRDLAAWLTRPEHPLTARVAVNRFWQAMFGQGLVRTSEDFGLQGSLPTHPELLDWLAVDFVESGWDVKRLLKMIVMSRAYRQISDPTRELLELDPENTLLARGPSQRLPAEMIRDAALSAGGLLIPRLGGPPVKPYQPAGLWKEKSGKTYTREEGEGSHRRSLYTYWKRTSPPPAMMTLDASNREVCVVKRQVTMTPLQMLVLLNDPQYVEAAKALAMRAMAESNELEPQLKFVFRSLAARAPDKRELDVIERMFQSQLEEFQIDAASAMSLLQVGDAAVGEEFDAIRLAALTVVAEGLMTYDETVMKR